MRRIFIEMGQGIVLRSDAVIVSSALHSCCLIGAYNASMEDFGAFHYPAEALAEPKKYQATIGAMRDWIMTIVADQIEFTFAQGEEGLDRFSDVRGSSAEDQEALQQWFLDQGFRGCLRTPKKAGSGAVMRKGKKLFTGRETEVLEGVKDVSAQEDCSNLKAGEHVLTGGLKCEIFGIKNP